MDLKAFLKKRFGKDLFGLKEDDIIKERLKIEKRVEVISEDIRGVQEKIQRLMVESKGQPRTLKLLNVQKIKALRLESNTKQQEATQFLKQLQLLLLVETMKERQKEKTKSPLVERVLTTDIEQLNQILMDKDVVKAFEEGKMDEVKSRLSRIFAKEELPVDTESREILKAMEDLESVDEETALQMAGEKAKQLAEEPLKKKEKELEGE
jgi:hypothetical protein